MREEASKSLNFIAPSPQPKAIMESEKKPDPFLMKSQEKPQKASLFTAQNPLGATPTQNKPAGFLFTNQPKSSGIGETFSSQKPPVKESEKVLEEEKPATEKSGLLLGLKTPVDKPIEGKFFSFFNFNISKKKNSHRNLLKHFLSLTSQNLMKHSLKISLQVSAHCFRSQKPLKLGQMVLFSNNLLLLNKKNKKKKIQRKLKHPVLFSLALLQIKNLSQNPPKSKNKTLNQNLSSQRATTDCFQI